MAWNQYNEGNKKALSDFFDKHPEYQARLALRRDPADELQQFLKSNIWDAYTALGPTDKKKVNALMGDQFSQFLQSDPGQEFSTDQLATWARMLNASVPQTADTAPALAKQITPINPMDPSVTKVTDEYFTERSQKFPTYYMLQQGYYSVPPSERNSYLLRFPQLKAYMAWNAKWKADYPDLVPVFNGQVFKQVDTSNWDPTLVGMVSNYALTGKKMPQGATKLLQQYWTMQGQPYGDFQSWLDSDLVPAFKNQMTGGLQP